MTQICPSAGWRRERCYGEDKWDPKPKMGDAEAGQQAILGVASVEFLSSEMVRGVLENLLFVLEACVALTVVIECTIPAV